MLFVTEFTGLPPHVVPMAHMEEMKMKFQKEMMKVQEILLVEIQTKFYQWCLGMDGFFETQQVLTWMEVLEKDVMNRLGYKTAGAVR